MDQQETGPVALGHRGENRSRPQFALGEGGIVTVLDLARMAFFMQFLKSLDQAHAGTSEKVVPWLVTVRSSPASSTSCSQVERLIRASVPWRTAR